MSDRAIIEAVRKITGTQLHDTVSILAVTVTAVNVGTRTFDGVTIGGDGVTDLLGIQLMPGITDGFLIVPALGSVVICGMSKRNQPFALLFSDISELSITTGAAYMDVKSGSVVISAPQVQLNDGSYGGLVEVSALVTQLNNLEKAVNKIIIAVTALGGISPAAPLIPTVRTILENTTITHGK